MTKFSPGRRIWMGSLRVVSTLAAIAGVLLLLIGTLSSLSGRGAASGTATSGTSVYSNVKPNVPAATLTALSTPEARLSPGNQNATEQAQASAGTNRTPTPMSSPVTAAHTTPEPPRSQPGQHTIQPQYAPPDELNLNRPVGRLTIGFALLLLGILGTLTVRLLNRRKQL